MIRTMMMMMMMEMETPMMVMIMVAVPLLLAWVMMTSYTGMNFPGIALPQLTNPDTDDVYLEPHTVALFVSTIHVGTVAGSLVSGHLLVHLGRRTTILIGLPLGAAAWLGLVFFSHVWILMLCRVLTGCSFALVKQPTVMYMVEVAHESLRGRLVGLLCIAKEIGLFSSYVLGSLMLTWRQICIIYACIMVPPMIGIYFLPSSPRWLTTRGRVNEAHKSLVFFRGRRGNVDAELQEVVRQAEDAGGANKGTWQQLRLLTKPGTLRTFLLILSIMLLYPLQGSMLVYPYLAVILDTPGAPINLALSSVLCSTCKIFGTIVHLITVDYFGRVPIIAVGNSFISICTAAYGYFHLLGDNTDGISWLPMASISALMFLTGTVSPLMDVLQGELIPNACRAVTIPILSCLNGMVGFAAVQMFPYLTDILGMHAMFGLFTVFNLIAALIGVTAVPETRGLTLEAINDLVGSSKGHKSPRCQRRAVAGPNTAEECIKTSQSV
ncbi:Facilitated trehalose transporter Tret1 [Chionoecetes opilio]|uniref:Facilitated trehalose transporter Tret1 n=1 Tax=Chionoecetes opilio TaxID=41210 RepID=A0A8J5CS20_CHIOP|nr:Facilitated trehalose transporter Tret1 [Chionoecetes opilio]